MINNDLIAKILDLAVKCEAEQTTLCNLQFVKRLIVKFKHPHSGVIMEFTADFNDRDQLEEIMNVLEVTREELDNVTRD